MNLFDIFESEGEYILYFDGKPVAKYDSVYDAEFQARLVKKKVPDLNFEIKKEVCTYQPVQLKENLRDWFKDKWVRFGPDGKIRGDCARGDSSEGKPKCLPQAKAHALGKKGRAQAAARKRREDPNPERHGAAINVNTKKKSNEGVAEGVMEMDKSQTPPGRDGSTDSDAGKKEYTAKATTAKKVAKDAEKILNKELNKELNKKQGVAEEKCPHCSGPMFSESMINEKKDACYYKVKSRYKVWPSAYASGALVKCRKKGADSWGNKSESLNEFASPDSGDGSGPDEEEILFRLAQKWWTGSEQDMIRAQRTLEAMGWEIGEDEGYDNGGVFVVRAGDEHGKSYISWPHEDLQSNEGMAEAAGSNLVTQYGDNVATDSNTPVQTGNPIDRPESIDQIIQKHNNTASTNNFFDKYDKLKTSIEQDNVGKHLIRGARYVPGVGPALAGLDIASAASKGDVKPAITHAVNTAISKVPVVGPLYSMANQGMDMYKRLQKGDDVGAALSGLGVGATAGIPGMAPLKAGARLASQGNNAINKVDKYLSNKERPESIEAILAQKGQTVSEDSSMHNVKEYYNVVGTNPTTLRKEFHMSKDKIGWFLKEGSTPRHKLDAIRAFGSPKLKEYDLAAFSGGTQTKGEDNVISPVGSKTRAQYKK